MRCAICVRQNAKRRTKLGYRIYIHAPNHSLNGSQSVCEFHYDWLMKTRRDPRGRFRLSRGRRIGEWEFMLHVTDV